MADGPTRRFDYVSELEAEGLAPPDEATMEYLRLIVDEGVLGASRHVALGLEMLAHILRTAAPAEALRRAEAAAGFVARTRGQDTPVIGNSLASLMAGLAAVPAPDRAAELADRIARFTKEATARRAHLVDAAARHLAGRRGLLAFDYSSTVAAIVLRIAGADPRPEVVVPESRTIDGGEKYLREFAAAGIPLRFLPDAALGWGLARCDTVLLGVETLRADGSFLNTIGSAMLARLAHDQGAEVYAATELVKLDRRSYAGHRPPPALRRYDRLVPTDLPTAARAAIDTTAPELEVVPATLTTAILTEFGPVPPAAIWALGREIFGSTEEPSP